MRGVPEQGVGAGYKPRCMDLPSSTATYRLFRPNERPDVLVTLDDGDEVEGELRARKRVSNGWVASVPPGREVWRGWIGGKDEEDSGDREGSMVSNDVGE